MNHTGVTSTGSRRQALRKRLNAQGSALSPVRVEQLAGERDEFFEPERLIAKLGAKLSNLVRLCIVQIVIARYDGDRSRCQPGNGSDSAQELETAGKGHPEVEDHRMGPMSLGQAEPFIG